MPLPPVRRRPTKLRCLALAATLLATPVARAEEDESTSALEPASRPLYELNAAMDGDAWRNGDRAPIEGILGLEATLQALQLRMDEVTMLTARWGGDAYLPGHLSDQIVALDVAVQRIADGEVLARSVPDGQVPWRSTPAGPDRSCTVATLDDSRPLELQPWDTRHIGGRTPRELGHGRPALFYLETRASRTALVQLEPGESVTVVEVLDPSPRQPERQIRLRRGDRELTVTEGEQLQQVCLAVTPSVAPAPAVEADPATEPAVWGAVPGASDDASPVDGAPTDR